MTRGVSFGNNFGLNTQRYRGTHSFTWVEKVNAGLHKIFMRASYDSIWNGSPPSPPPDDNHPSQGPHENVGGASLSPLTKRSKATSALLPQPWAVSCGRVALQEDFIGGLCRGYRALALSVLALCDRI